MLPTDVLSRLRTRNRIVNTNNHFLVRKWLVISSDTWRSDSSILILSRSNAAILIVGNGVTRGSDVIGDTNIKILILPQDYKKCMKYTNFCEKYFEIFRVAPCVSLFFLHLFQLLHAFCICINIPPLNLIT